MTQHAGPDAPEGARSRYKNNSRAGVEFARPRDGGGSAHRPRGTLHGRGRDTKRLSARDLYRGADQQPIEAFQDWALERLSRDPAFDSALWASASATKAGPIGHLAHLYRQPAHMIADYEALKHMNTVNAASLKQPGKTLFVNRCASWSAAARPWRPCRTTPWHACLRSGR